MSVQGKKVFVGSLPDGVQAQTIRDAFAPCGIVEDIFVKPGCEPGRQWAFVTFQNMEQAQYAKDTCDRVLMLPGSIRPVDVMPAKNQGMFGQDSMPMDGMGGFGGMGGGMGQMAPAPTAMKAPRKIFVGSLPDGTGVEAVHGEFAKYGTVEDVFMKQNCEPGRQWAFVLYADERQAQYALDMTNGILVMPGGIRACEVTLARNQGMFGQDAIAPGPGQAPQMQMAMPGPVKIFVGSLPDGITDQAIRAEFSKYGEITDIFIKTGQAPNRQWCFISFSSPHSADAAKVATDRILMFPGGDQCCEVTFARHQGMFGQDALGNNLDKGFKGGGKGVAPQYGAIGGHVAQPGGYGAAPPPAASGPKKIFVGSLPDNITETALRAEFSKYGHVTDVFLKQGCESNRQWAFITFATMDQAQWAKDSTDRVLVLPGSDRACEVMLARNQGKFGQEAIGGCGGGGGGMAGGMGGMGGMGGGAGGYGYAPAPQAAIPAPSYGGLQPPPPSAPPPAHLTPWRQYKTASGLPYYHNHTTGVTQWEAPPELQVSANRFSPY